MSSITDGEPETTSYDSAAQLFDRIGELFNKPAALATPRAVVRQLQQPFKELEGIPKGELETLRMVVAALSLHLDKIVPGTHAAEKKTSKAPSKTAIQQLPPQPHVNLAEGDPDGGRVLKEDVEVRSILAAARLRQAAPMSNEDSVREGAEFMQAMRLQSSATLLRRIERKELLSSKALQDALHIRRQSISDAVKAGRLFAIVGPSGENYYPAFYADQRLDRRAVEKVSKALAALPATSKYFFFTSKLTTLGETPLEALRKGRLEEVLVAATAFAVN